MNLIQIGDLGANILGRDGDHNIKERIKDSFKRVMATRIRQTVEKGGIDNMFKLSFSMDVVPLDNALYGIRNPNIKGVDIYVTKDHVQYPIRFPNDVPFTFVGIDATSFINCGVVEFHQILRRTPHIPSNGGYKAYLWHNKKLFILIDRRTPNGTSRLKIDKVRVESIWADPEEILMKYDLENDGQEIVVPFADDQVETILYEILKTEYHFVPKETTVTVNPSVIPQNAGSN